MRPLLRAAAAAACLALAACGSDGVVPTDPASPAPASAADAPAASSTRTPPAPAAPVPAHYVFPVVGADSIGRTHHDYPASDVMAPCGATVRAATDGVVLEVSTRDTWDAAVNDGATRGGLSVSFLGDDGVRYYGSHLSAIDPAVAPGVRVTAGQTLGTVGDTGLASACHLHFGISPPCAGTGDWWTRRGAVWPWRFLESWRDGGQLSPVDEVLRWQRDHGCPSEPADG